ncbi:glycosyltransferase [Pelagibacteraceae bacterium]|nr:glycosyltransferase [Pelagibacteraceae bacterium]
MADTTILALIVPVYHEQENISKLISKINSHIKIPIKIYFIYDSYDDPTVKAIENEKNNCNFEIFLKQNIYGNGALNAIKTGFQTFSEEACVVVMADGSDDLSSINGMYGLFCQGFHIVCASRYMRNGKQIGGGIIKKTLSKLAGKSLYYFSTLPTHDATNSFKLYSKKIIREVKFESKGGFEIGIEILCKAHLLNYAISEIPTIWKDRYDGTSKFQLLNWLPHYLKWYLKIVINRSILFKTKREIIYNKIRPVGY